MDHADRIQFGEAEPFLDLRHLGYTDIIGGTYLEGDNGVCSYRFLHSLVSDTVEDDWLGTHNFTTYSQDRGSTWSPPVMVTLDRVKDVRRESSYFGPVFRTREGTWLHYGQHQLADSDDGAVHQDKLLRPYMNLYARQEQGQPAVDIVEWPPGTFLAEQFMEGGFQLPSGRLVFTMWGIRERGENWRCGVLLSDDDGWTWRFRTVGYESDPAIRDAPDVPAGFNEQTLFQSPTGKLVSIIRAREGLGRGVPGGGARDTWFFRSESDDEGETWSTPVPTNLPGTGATIGQGLVLPDGSFLIGCRVPYSREMYRLPEHDLFGLHFARSFDQGAAWVTENIIQRDRDGNAMNSHHCAMNGQFVKRSAYEYDYIFGFFGYTYEPKLQRILKVSLSIHPARSGPGGALSS